jgi:hypothetical protein
VFGKKVCIVEIIKYKVGMTLSSSSGHLLGLAHIAYCFLMEHIVCVCVLGGGGGGGGTTNGLFHKLLPCPLLDGCQRLRLPAYNCSALSFWFQSQDWVKCVPSAFVLL